MSASLSKRQQARNERTLQELIKTVPGNNVCADCQARNPGWASWSLGIFLCMRCAAIHRKLGTHISKVKSLSMDSWSNEQVENMKKTGNIASNRIYNPQNAKPAIPFDADEADSAMERFIRQKYQDNNLGVGRTQAPVRHDTGTTGSTESDDIPPPLPPKTGSKFGFRSASSIFPMSSKAKREAAARAHLESEREQRRSPSPPVRNKASRVFGAVVGSEESHGDNLANKLVTLRQMGFTDDKRNLAILKEKGGNLEKTVASLVKPGAESDPAPRSRTPLSATAGITIQRTRERESPKVSNNPFDIPSAPPQSSQSTGTLANPQHVNGSQYQSANSTNPFGLPPSQSQYNLHQQYALDQSFQNMSLGQSQTLFPNHTGGFPNRQVYQNTGGSPMPTIPQHFAPSVFDNQPQQQQSQQSQNYNPFLQQQQQQQQAPFPQAFNPAGNMSPSNPYAPQQQAQAQTFPQQAYYDQSQQQQQACYDPNQQFQNSQQYQQPQMTQQQNNPYGVQIQQNPQPAQNPQQYMQFQSQPQQLLPQQTGRADKSSILALYNYPQLAPVAPQMQSPIDMNQHQDPNTQAFLSGGGGGGIPMPMPNHQQQQQRSISSPLATYASGNRNPFLSGGNGPLANNAAGGNGLNVGIGIGNGVGVGAGTAGPGQARHVSQESVSVDSGGWLGQNGRHSPDAFANLSARSMR